MSATLIDERVITTIFDGSRPTARHLRKSKVVVLTGAEVGRELEIVKSRVTGGRSVVNDLVLSDKAISGTHFEIVAQDDGYRLRDLDSTNGIHCGDLRVRDVTLRPGLQFRVGHSELRFVPTEEIVEIALSQDDRFGGVIGTSLRMREIFATLEKVAPSDLTVLLTGETGSGKERVARALHRASPRSAKPFVVLDCGAIPKDLIESILFGHEKGSFTGAAGQHRGCFEQAHGGTIFLDEIGELDLALQPKLLRVLENHELKRVGGEHTIHVDVRVVAATNRDLRAMVAASTFREDLYFRLSVIQLELPPLRERRQDIEPLALVLLHDLCEKRRAAGGPVLAFSPEALELLRQHSWPGNVRELKNVIERAASLCEGTVIKRDDLVLSRSEKANTHGSVPPYALMSDLSFKEAKQQVVDHFEVVYLKALLDRHDRNITRSANEAGLTRYHLRELLKRHGLASPRDVE